MTASVEDIWEGVVKPLIGSACNIRYPQASVRLSAAVVGIQSDLEVLQNLFNWRPFSPILAPTMLNELPHFVCQAPLEGNGAAMTTRTDTPEGGSRYELGVI